MRTITIILLLLASLSVASAKSPVESAMADRWDSLRFSFAVLQSDYAVESPVFVIYRLSDGGQLISYYRDKIATRHLDVSEFERIKSDLLLAFADAPKERPSYVEPNPPELIMSFFVDQGFNRSAFEKRLKPDDKSKALEVFSGLVRQLTPTK